MTVSGERGRSAFDKYGLKADMAQPGGQNGPLLAVEIAGLLNRLTSINLNDVGSFTKAIKAEQIRELFRPIDAFLHRNAMQVSRGQTPVDLVDLAASSDEEFIIIRGGSQLLHCALARVADVVPCVIIAGNADNRLTSQTIEPQPCVHCESPERGDGTASAADLGKFECREDCDLTSFFWSNSKLSLRDALAKFSDVRVYLRTQPKTDRVASPCF